MPRVARSLRLLSSPPAFFLEETLDGSVRLLAEDQQHATRVLRLSAGALLIGLDGRGHRFPLRVRAVRRNELELESAGPVEFTPAPGEEGAPMPWFEVAVSWPRKNRVEPMLGRLVQLGAAAVRPLVARQRGPETVSEESAARHLRIAREACKQSGRAWLPVLEPATAPEALAALRSIGALAVLDPRAGLAFDTWLRSLHPSPAGLGARARPIVLAIGPEGGFTGEEQRAFLELGASPVWLGPHVLRVETAAEAAMAVAAAVHGRHPDPGTWA
jgi:16S rRNA (uracil1498-N3)-methyltransferase